jgi:hypothetical protein
MPPLTQLAAAAVMADEATDLADLDKASRLVVTLATKLRLTCQSRLNERAASRVAEVGRADEAGALDPLLGGDIWWSDDEERN